MNRLKGEVPGANPRDRAVWVAGKLAELGVGSLVLVRGSERVDLIARRTDMPGLLGESGASWVVKCDRVRVIAADGVVQWIASDDTVAAVLRGEA